jgi:ribosome-binding factor A
VFSKKGNAKEISLNLRFKIHYLYSLDMAGTRVEKFERQMQRDLGEIFRAKAIEWFSGAFISVSIIRSSPDLGYVKCYVSILPQTSLKLSNEEVMKMITERSRDIRKHIAMENKHLRKVPEFQFFEDNSLEYVSKMEALFNSIKKDTKD